MNAPDPGAVRTALIEARRLVVKVGSRFLASDPSQFPRLASQLAAERAEGREVILVSSGAIAMGVRRLGLTGRPKDIARLQAAAAAGQSGLMRAWEEAFSAYRLPLAQVLLTHADLEDRDRYLNARAALDAVVELGAIPVINENDTVAVEEIRFGDNDRLAAMVATLVSADLLLLLTDVDGLLDHDDRRISVVTDPKDAMKHVRSGVSASGVGGMASKIEAARRATKHGVPVVVGPAAEDSVVAQVVRGSDVGTLFLPHGVRLASRKHWIAYTRRPRGTVVVDDGAAVAVRGGQSSLLPAGVQGVRGDFDVGDAVSIVTLSGAEIARGLTRYSVHDVARLAGAKTAEIERRLGRPGGDEIVHRDDLVVL